MLKKVILVVFILVGSILGVFSFLLDVSVKYVNGNIIWYNGVGKKGFLGKKFGYWDCVIKIGFDVLKNGIKIRVYVKVKFKKVIMVYKNDVGRMFNVVLDVSFKVFKVFGYLLSKGKVVGYYSY